MRTSRSFLIFAIVLVLKYGKINGQVNDTIWKGFSVSCMNEEKSEVANVSVSCHGIRLVRKIVQKFLEDARRKRNLEILDGISLVERDDVDESSRSGRVLKGQMGTVMSFLENRELRIKLPSLLPGNLEAVIEKSLPSIDQGRGHGGGGFGGGKKGDQGVLLMAMMMGKMMAAMGFGALALLAMKALMVSALALMLSLIVAAKKLASSKDDSDNHHVVYAQEVSHHRRRRGIEASLDDLETHPYRAHVAIPTPVQKLR